MEKKGKTELDNKSLERIVTLAQEEKKPFDIIKKEFGVSEKEVTELMRMRLNKDNFELWKKKVAANKPKPKPQKFNPIEDDDLDSKYYFKNKFD
ncbi:TIGR03643 family protein [Flavobacterium sp. N2270]|uniref:TIGR03643 family protein n=1 Tax=Flavobacterium sp. N2270 TaxID=2986831 RepID=UPI0022259F51|nr:TIGR03643 family protein [Flavobacterium sp. N2270]